MVGKERGAGSTKSSATKTRSGILDYLKKHGPTDSQTLAEQFGISPMAVRQHLYDQEEQKLVTFIEESRSRGRPAKLWKLTPKADRFFPNAHADLTVGIIQSVESVFGSEAMGKLLQQRVQQQVQQYRAEINESDSLEKKVKKLAAIRDREGYMAEWKKRGTGNFELIENHCPICTAATHCMGFCDSELKLFRLVFGKTVTIERVEHIVRGARRCVYTISEKR